MMTRPDTGHWTGGWWRPAVIRHSPHRGLRPEGACIDLIVVHSISLPPGVYGGDEVERLFMGQLDCNAHPYFEHLRGLRVSAHFFVRRDGAVWQFASCDDRAWHAGQSHYRGRGNCNDDSVGIELEGLEGEPFELPQYDALALLCQAIRSRYPIAHVAGHEHIAPGRKHDPGIGFDWAALRGRLGWADQVFPQYPAVSKAPQGPV